MAKRPRLTTEELEHVARNVLRALGLEDTQENRERVKYQCGRWSNSESAIGVLARCTFKVCEEIRNRRRSGRDLIQPGEVVD